MLYENRSYVHVYFIKCDIVMISLDIQIFSTSYNDIGMYFYVCTHSLHNKGICYTVCGLIVKWRVVYSCLDFTDVCFVLFYFRRNLILVLTHPSMKQDIWFYKARKQYKAEEAQVDNILSFYSGISRFYTLQFQFIASLVFVLLQDNNTNLVILKSIETKRKII